MRAQLLKVCANPSQSFSVRRDYAPVFENIWHFHQEIEIIYFQSGSGTQFIGDSIRKFRSGDIVMIGSNLPHFWRFDESDTGQRDIHVIHFNADFWGDGFLNLPETKLIQELINQARFGLQLTDQIKKPVVELILKLEEAKTVFRLTLLLQILEHIASSDEHRLLSSTSFNPGLQQSESKRINDIYQFSFSNFKKKIAIEDVAVIANISPTSFCKYFKNQTGKTYSQFLTEYRIGVACKLLIEDKYTLQQICYESGFNNFVSFHRHFKNVTKKTPAVYQKEFFYKKRHSKS
ncbi:AraC family transcriptional regulator [Pedobacter aquatilis]|uniref:AraC family transcriptional regulator n=1 Tax=Pedobacter aquatilis TaxID=351343 RepID=UPI00292F80DF|nr:AraC family transcriptional regulator [Pedobacter aquatilis]